MFLTLLFNLSFLGFIVSNIGREIPNTSSRITEERAQKNKSNLGITVYYQAYESFGREGEFGHYAYIRKTIWLGFPSPLD